MKMKPTDLQSGMYITYSVEHNNKLIQSCWSCENTQNIKNVLTKSYIENFSEEPFAIMEKKNAVPWTYVVSNIKGEKIIGTFYEKELHKASHKKYGSEKTTKIKGNRLC